MFYSHKSDPIIDNLNLLVGTDPLLAGYFAPAMKRERERVRERELCTNFTDETNEETRGHQFSADATSLLSGLHD